MQEAHKVSKEVVSSWTEGDGDSAKHKEAFGPQPFASRK